MKPRRYNLTLTIESDHLDDLRYSHQHAERAAEIIYHAVHNHQDFKPEPHSVLMGHDSHPAQYSIQVTDRHASGPNEPLRRDYNEQPPA